MITFTQLRKLYLQDLELPDTFHERTTPKVRNIGNWRDIIPFTASGTFIDLSEILLDPSRNIFCFSDIHFFHKNIIKYCNRPYPNVEIMNECIISNYLNAVQPQDVVIFGGDIGFGTEGKINDILNRLPGYKIQIIGNHDMHRDGKLYDLAFNERHLCMPLHINVGKLEYDLLFTHYPLDSVPKKAISIHGHIHNNIVPGNKHVNICVEHTNYTPMNITLIIEKLKNTLAL